MATAFPGLWLKFWCTWESWADLCGRSSTACFPIPFGNLGDIEYLCQNMRHGVTYSWQSRSNWWHIIEVLAHLWFVSQRVGSWGMTRVFLAKCSFRCRGSPGLWFKIMYNCDHQFCPKCASSICMKPTLTSCEWLWMYHSSPATPQEWQISHRSAYTCSM